MADRLTGILGTEQESPELETREPPRGPDAFAAAVAARLSAGEREVAERTAQFLQEQTRFVKSSLAPCRFVSDVELQGGTNQRGVQSAPARVCTPL